MPIPVLEVPAVVEDATVVTDATSVDVATISKKQTLFPCWNVALTQTP